MFLLLEFLWITWKPKKNCTYLYKNHRCQCKQMHGNYFRITTALSHLTAVLFILLLLTLLFFLFIFTVRRSLHGICYSNSVRPSVCLSVCHTRGLCPHGSTYDHDFFTTGSPIILVSGISRSSQNSKGVTPSEGVGWGWGGYELAIFDQ